MYILEGNIGVGKTTFLTLLKNYLAKEQSSNNTFSFDIVTEPVNDWDKQMYGQSLLENFYNNTPRWAYTLETFTMICRVKDHIREQNHKNPWRILERSIYSGHYCFAKNCFQTGFLSSMEWEIYNQWVDFLIHKHCKPPHGFIYLKADPQTCFDRVKQRNRPSEKSLTLDYMINIDRSHDLFLVKKQDISPALKATPVLVLDCNEDFEFNQKNMNSHAEKVKDFLTLQPSHQKNKPALNL